mmetsp:Transcript_10332/g.18073  ORF Transcript_10332/g.18073 Transcript_10332/m.18073 type:complete len:347 (+) Transcript_10332:78-1118(+)
MSPSVPRVALLAIALLACLQPLVAKKTFLIGAINSWEEYDLKDGTYYGTFLQGSPISTSPSSANPLRSTDSIALKGSTLYVSTYYADSTSDSAAPGAILTYTKKGQFQGRFDVNGGLLRPYGLVWYNQGKNLLVAGLGNDAIVKFDDVGNLLGNLASANNSRASTQGPNAFLLDDKEEYVYITTEGSKNVGGTITFPYDSGVLKIRLSDGAVVKTDFPGNAVNNAGFVSLLGLDYVADEVIVVSDFAGGLRFYDLDLNLLSTTDTSYVVNAATGERSTLFYGQVRVVRDHIYLTAFDYNDGNKGLVLRFNLDGTPSGSDAANPSSPVWIAKTTTITRAIGIFLFDK